MINIKRLKVLQHLILGFTIGISAGLAYYVYDRRKWIYEQNSLRDEVDRRKNIIQMQDIWLSLRQRGQSLEEYLLNKGIHRIAIYGMNSLGVRLWHEFYDSTIKVKYTIDSNKGLCFPGIDICYSLEDAAERKDEVDLVIITVLASFDKIKEEMRQQGFEKVIGLDEILYDLI